ncbi:MAG: acyl-CoA dehydrogenase family protein [Halieaceae bacterium]|jgi:alkylation response protein AidB-like acyl-CoA dehydrogenase|nr:acyl-CoA dehydrogenase family protein [Halieaceae bacterium]
MSDAELLFDLTPTEEQQMTREVMRRFAREEMASAARPADEAGALPEGFLLRTVDLGLNFMPVPEALGGVGAGRSPISNALNIEDLAWGDMSMAIAALAPLSVINCVMDYGTDAQKERVSHTLASADFTPAAMALMEPAIGFDPRQPATTALLRDDGSYVIEGAKSMVAFGPEAKLLLVFADTVKEGTQAFLLAGDTPGISFEKEDYMGLRPLPLYGMALQNVVVPASARLGSNFDLKRTLSLGKIATAALAVGTCQAVLDYVIPYVNERVAFGEPVSNRQAVAFMVADMATEIEGLRLMVYRAAAQAERGLDCTRIAFLAHRSAIRYGMKIGTDGVQLLGGHGFTREHPVEMWYRNLRALAVLDGMLLV